MSSGCRKGGLQHGGLGWGRGRWLIKSIEEHVQVICPLLVLHRLGIRFLEARDGFQASPDSTSVFLLQLILHLLPVGIFPLSDLPSQQSLHSLQLILIS